MNVFPVVAREMREQARQAATYWYRLAGAGGGVLVGMWLGVDRLIQHREGGPLFWVMHWFLFWAIWGLVPLMTADSISRERREGTLGLLLLTPLKAWDVVIAKGIVDGLRGVTVGVAAVPVLVVPFLLGGVSWTLVLGSLVCNLCSFWLAMGAGLVASSGQVTMHQAIGWAYFYAALFLLGMVLLLGLWLSVVASLNLGLPRRSWLNWPYGPGMLTGLFTLSGWEDWRLIGRGGGRSVGLWRIAFQAGALGGAFLVFLFSIRQAAANVRGKVLERPRTVFQMRMAELFCTPKLGRALFRRWMRRRIERNPVGWLELRTWQARIVTWSWLAVLISLYSVFLTDSRIFMGMFEQLQRVLGAVLLLSMAMASAGSFRRERESGFLELMLVTPLSARQIVVGRLRGLWNQFLPALILLVGVWIYIGQARNWLTGAGPVWMDAWGGMASDLMVYAAAYAAVPAVGLYFSLRCSGWISALVWTVVCVVGIVFGSGLLVDWVDGFKVVRRLVSYEYRELFGGSGLSVLGLLGLGLGLGWSVQGNLEQRRFSLRKGETG